MDPARRAPALGALAVAVAALASGCTATNPQLTHSAEVTYNPSDGTNVALGPIRVQSLMVISAGGQGPGTLVARLVNTTLHQHRVTLTGTGGTALDETFSVPANSILAVGPDQDQAVTLDPVGAQPGELVRLTASVDGGASETTVVPVLSGTLPEYSTLVPTPSTPAPTSATPTSTAPTGSGSPTGSATRTTGTPSSPPVVTSTRSASPTGGAKASQLPKYYSPGGTPTG